MRFKILAYLLLIQVVLFGQKFERKVPNFSWQITNKKITNEFIEFNINALITEGWMITTETDTSEFAIPLRIELKKQDSVLMKKIEITQIKGEKTYNTKLQKNIGGFKIETTQGNVEYRIKIFLKSIKKPIKISGSIAYWVLCEDAATPPSEQAFTLYF